MPRRVVRSQAMRYVVWPLARSTSLTVPAHPPRGISSKSGTVTPDLTRTLAPGSNRGDVVDSLGLVMGSLGPGPRSRGADRLEADRDLAHPGQGVPPISWPDHSKNHGPSVARATRAPA